jgi:hypothetical protein
MSLVKDDKPLTHEQEAFKNAFGRAIDRVGSSRRMAEMIGVSDGQVSRWKHAHYDEHVPAALHSKIDAAAGYPCMLETSASLAGFSIRRDDVSPDTMTLCEAIGVVAEDSGRAVRVALEANRDQHICQRDMNLIEAEGKTVIANTTRMIEAARAKFEAGQGASVHRLVGGARNG